MALLVLSDTEALSHVREDHSRWPLTAKAQADRLTPFAQPHFQPSFGINKHESIFTIGSCFARNIEKQLLVEGYNVALPRFAPPEDPAFKAEADTLLHRFTVHSIVNDLTWALDPQQPFPQEGFVEVAAGEWIDLQLSPLLAASSRAMVEARRRAVRAYFALAAEARVFIMTLGLAEVWFDTLTGTYLNAQPPTRVRKAYPGRFQFHLTEYDEVLHHRAG